MIDSSPVRVPGPLFDEARRLGDLDGTNTSEVIRAAIRRGLDLMLAERAQRERDRVAAGVPG